jgi:hypothetical protein
MSSVRPFASRRRQKEPWHEPIDLGGGRTARPEDLLEGHFQRLTEQVAGSVQVDVQTPSNLRAAVRVSAPGLAPLAEVAEGLAVRMPIVQPDSGFRTELQRSLEEAHRRQLQQRSFAPPSSSSAQRNPLLWIVIGGLVLGLASLWMTNREARAV